MLQTQTRRLIVSMDDLRGFDPELANGFVLRKPQLRRHPMLTRAASLLRFPLPYIAEFEAAVREVRAACTPIACACGAHTTHLLGVARAAGGQGEHGQGREAAQVLRGL